MFIRFLLFSSCLLLLFSCKETSFMSGIENTLTAIIDMAPETYESKVDFTSDDQIANCPDHDVVYLDKWTDGSIDNTYYTIRIEAKDFYKSENNCEQYDWYTTQQELVQHQLEIKAYVNEIDNQMYVSGSHFSNHPDYPTNRIAVQYKLYQDEDGQDNDGQGIEYFGYDAELDIKDLNLSDGVMSGTFSATLYRGTPVNDPGAFMGVDNFTDLDLYNPLLNDMVDDYDLTDSIRIENCVFQRITVINNIP